MAITYPAGPIQDIEEEFILADRTALLAYLMNQMAVVPHLVNLVQQARGIYGEDTRVSLRRDADPDADSDYLVVGIRSVLAPAEAQHLLYKLRDGWWSTTPSDIADQILVANEYVQPCRSLVTIFLRLHRVSFKDLQLKDNSGAP